MDIKNKKLKVVITGGGTGGHIYPAIAVAQKLKLDEDVENIYYVGCPYNMEKEIAEKENLEFLPIAVSGMPRKNFLSIFKWFIELNYAVRTCISHLNKVKPDVILGTGGYVSGPVLISAIILRIPFIIHDPDAHPGIVNRFMAPWAKFVSIAFEQAKSFINSKNIEFIGNPIRSNFNKIDKKEALSALNLDVNKKTLLVMGGSQGAKSINNAIISIAQELIEKHNIQIIHQTGKKNFEEVSTLIKEKFPSLLENQAYIVKPYFDNMEIPLNCADLAVSRAGSLSISELNLVGLPSILIPYPFAAADHQRYNARAMEKTGASIYLEDNECNSPKFIELITSLLNDNDKLESMITINKDLSKPNAAENLVQLIKKTVKKA